MSLRDEGSLSRAVASQTRGEIVRGQPKTTNTLRQVHKIRGGQIELKISTEGPLSAREIEDFGSVVTACEQYVEKWEPIRDERLDAEAREQEFKS